MERKLQIYFIGVFWFILSTISSSFNDVISKHVGSNINSYEITFFRFLFSSLTLLPFVIYYGANSLKTSNPSVHIMRGFLLFLAISAWNFGLKIAPMTTATIVSFTIPIFVLILGFFFLKEHIIWQRWFVTLFVFVGLFITINPQNTSFDPAIMILVMAAILFAILDIINKKFVIQETMISMLFYSAVITTIFAYPFALQNWDTPSGNELLLLLALGASANLILFLLLKAFALVDATALAPYRYFELVISGISSYVIFAELPTQATILGAIIIIPSTFFIIYSEKKHLKT
jgi:S-adenosylmethionine uptake transporter